MSLTCLVKSVVVRVDSGPMMEGLWDALDAAVSTRGVAMIPTSSSKALFVCCGDFGTSAVNQAYC